MARLTELKIGLGAGVVLALVLMLAGCGGDDPSVQARNLLTGEVQTFPSKDEVPPDWIVCDTPDCTVPPAVPCQKLSEKTCKLNPNCRLKVLWCEGTGTVSSDGSSTTTTETCKYQCIPKLPLLCEELTGEQQCVTRTDCEWAQGPCPMMCADDGKGGCLPCPYSCRTKAPPICQSLLDATQCQARPDCEWEPLACAAVCIDDGKGGCLPCDPAGTCKPKTVVPPPCPTIAPPPPGFCTGGKIVYQKDASGCVVGYSCEMPQPNDCWSLNAAFINAVKKAKACNPYSMMPVEQCSKQVKNALFCPVCPTFISPFNAAAVQEMADLEQKWLALSCDKLEIACPAMACPTPQSASCLPSSAGTGICTDDMPTP